MKSPTQRYLSISFFITSIITCMLISCRTDNADDGTARHPPNVVIMFVDDLGYGDLGVYGHPTIPTPNLDRLAREGQRWTNFYVASGVCTPSRGALLTGRLPVRIGLAYNHNFRRVFFPNSTGGLPLSELTMAELLREKGYATAAVGKWHLGHLPKYLPTQQGFDSYYGIPYSNDMDATGTGWKLEKFFETPNINYWNVPLMEGNQIIERPANQHTITKRYTERGIEFIRANQDRPFFLYLAHNLPHTPLFASDDFLNTTSRGLYGDVVAEVDWSAGRIAETLKELGLAENTLFVFTSDNGPWLLMKQAGGSAGLLRDGKGTTWEGGMRVPAIFWWPGKIKPGIRTDIGSTLDLLPTMAGLAGASLPTDRVYDGFDLTPTLFEDRPSPRDHMLYYRRDEVCAVRLGSFKAHFITETEYTADNQYTVQDPPLLFNLQVDPGEQYNIAEQHPTILEEIRSLVEAHKTTVKPVPCELDKKL